MLTPMDIENKEFKKGLRGYREEDVDEFLDIVKEDYEQITNENRNLKDKLSMYQEQINKYENIEGTAVYKYENTSLKNIDKFASTDSESNINIEKSADIDDEAATTL